MFSAEDRLSKNFKYVKQYISDNKKLPEQCDGRLQSLYELLTTFDTKDQNVKHAYYIFSDPFQKEIIEALLLAEAKPEDIYAYLGISEEVISIYSYLFFDTSVFFSHLDKLSYVENYTQNKFGKDIKVRALNLGPDFIFFRYTNINPTTEKQKHMIRKLFMASAYRAMEANYSTMDSSTSKQALEWGKIMLKAYETIDSLFDTDDDTADTIIKIVFGQEENGFTKLKENDNLDLV